MVNQPLDLTSYPELLNNVRVSKSGVEAALASLLRRPRVTSGDNFAAWLLKAISLVDLTTLSGDDTASNVQRLCLKASQPLSPQVSAALGYEEGRGVTTAAVCVYPSRVGDAARLLRAMELDGQIEVAAVATGFPSGLYSLKSRLLEIEAAVSAGATEVDVVIDRSLALAGRWGELRDELLRMRAACGAARMKVILGVGELATYSNVYRASMVAMSAGADFIKTSTGKEGVNATLPVGLVMCRAIRSFHRATGVQVGLKPAGGVTSAEDAMRWLVLVREELGPRWLQPALLRVGASSLLVALESRLREHATRAQAATATCV